MKTPAGLVVAILVAGCVPSLAPHRAAVSGIITGKVVDASGRPVVGARVAAVHYSRVVQLIPPADGQIVVAEAGSNRDGTFAISTSAAVDFLEARTHDFRMTGELHTLKQHNNVIVIRRSPPLPPPHP